ncbi:phenylalanine--tRNA ligase subunit alpha [Psittacicella melopsittaci]|uniref:Phenylalanine--tRNA ligase alpha subunit n=1 Tax=Psittacicella melopsittaci TaxID=2028576 RepID=A0A3A1Y8X4_9GAMM|nr:phenylalanine--tRNA ligase subunit alpha [Psittacicella melopsittaci]RIY33670.1 phenylalanine--tRNA ligase subunit alpha [Psittacicella melopsittaci]
MIDNSQLEQLVQEALAQIAQADSVPALEEVRLNYFGKKGHFSLLMQQLRDVPNEQKAAVGAKINEAKTTAQTALNARREEIVAAELNAKLEAERIDVTLPGNAQGMGGLHPVSKTINRVVSFFSEIGFTVVGGPEIESAYYNFDALNIPDHHPARADHDTFWFDAQRLLRTQTSGVQIRSMEKMEAPLRIIAPGRVYRNDYDQTHTPMFHQIELLFVDYADKVSFKNLKGVIKDMLTNVFEEELQIRFRPSYFPFTEPSAEVDVMGKNGKWLEVLGCGMVHPKVLESVGIDPTKYRGFAVGMGVERLTMLRYGVNDLRAFFENDLRFLKQFNN